jgi:hypothetical protein
VYRAQVEAAEAERQELLRRREAEERPIVVDLTAAGVPVSGLWQLNPGVRAKSVPYPDALPIVMAHLERGGYPDHVMEWLGRAFGAKECVIWWDDLKRLYLSARGPGEEDGLAVALSQCATKAQLNDLIAFLGIEKRGKSRIYFVRPIKRLGRERGREILEPLRDHPVLGREVTAVLAGKSPNE